MPEIFGLPGGMAVRRLGFEPTDWHARMELRAQVVHGLEANPAKQKTRRKWDDQAAAGPGQTDH